jgi:EAL and modified HD-GYP domain-containing signal transduction protein
MRGCDRSKQLLRFSITLSNYVSYKPEFERTTPQILIYPKMRSDSMNDNYLLGRQPILNRDEKIVAYELLFRSSTTKNSATFLDASQASASVIIDTLSSFGLESILGPKWGFINLEQSLLMDDSVMILPKDRIVLELLETIQVTTEFEERCRALKEAGFTLALDDHKFNPVYENLYSIVNIIKIDLVQTPAECLTEMVEHFRPYPVKLLAEKVETRDEYLLCRGLGFELFQGYYFAKPAIMEKKRFDDSGAYLLKLLRLVNEEAEVNAIEKVFRESPGMTYKLLLLVNSVSLGIRVKIQNIRQAVVLLGRQQIKRWVQLALFASDGEGGHENPLVEMAAVRAAFMEELASSLPPLKNNQNVVDQAFMIGILSLLETIYAVSIDEIIAALQLSGEAKVALTMRKGILGKLLHLVELVEQAEFKETMTMFEEIGLSHNMVMNAQINAYNWRSGMS